MMQSLPIFKRSYRGVISQNSAICKDHIPRKPPQITTYVEIARCICTVRFFKRTFYSKFTHAIIIELELFVFGRIMGQFFL